MSWFVMLISYDSIKIKTSELKLKFIIFPLNWLQKNLFHGALLLCTYLKILLTIKY